MRRLPLVLLLLAVLLGSACAAKSSGPLDRAWYAPAADAPEPDRPYHGFALTSRYVTMRDGVRLAVDLYLPRDLRPGDKVPTILTQTRYWRRPEVNPPFDLIFKIPDELREIVESGYAIVRLDARGTGASFGTRAHPWTPDETKDGAQIVDWIIAQPWSDGQVGAAGGSYEGTAAEFLATNGHPAVKAIAPMYALYDVYTDIAFPGGIHLEWFTKIWERGNRAMDRNQPQSFYWYARFFLRGVARVSSDPWGRERDAAARLHRRNYQVHQQARHLLFRDDISPGGFTPDAFSPHAYTDKLRAAKIPIYSYSGWFDGGYAHGAIKRFLTIENPGSRLILGPWDHGGDTHVRPFGPSVPAKFDHMAELRRFFDRHLKGRTTGIDAEPLVHYYTMVEDKWKTAANWPPAATATDFYFAADHALSRHAPPPGVVSYRVDPKAGTGDTTRWKCLAENLAVNYPDRQRRDRRLLVHDSAPLAGAMEVTGHAIAHLHIASDRSDGNFFVYLEDVDPDGNVAYVTEGSLRAVHRQLSSAKPPYRTPTPFRTFLRRDASYLQRGEVAELVFDLQPVSYLYRAGHRVRLAIAGEDADHFRPLGGPSPTIALHRGPATPSRVTLPVVR
jgi:uncharacterized protein